MPCVTITDTSDVGTRCATTLVSIRRWAVSRHNDFLDGGCFISQSNRGTTRLRLHSEGRALDINLRNWKRTANNEAMWALVNGLVDAHCSLGLQRIYFDKHVWTADDGVVFGPTAWTPMTAGQLKSGTYKSHAHIEIDVEHKDTYTFEDVQRILASLYIPGGNNDNVAPPPGDLNTGTPAATPTLASTDTTGRWTRDTMIETCAAIIEDTPLDQVHTYVICGGRGGYCVNFANAKIMSVGYGVNWRSSFTTTVQDFVPYQSGYFALLTDGTVEVGGYGSVPTFDCDDTGPWDHITSPETGLLVLTRVDPTTLRVTQCAGWFDPFNWSFTPEICCGGFNPVPDGDGGFVPVFP